MLPMEFDPRILRSLPLPDAAAVHRVEQVLAALVDRRVLPYFARRRRTEAVVVARAAECFGLERLEDPEGRIRTVSLLTRRGDLWRVLLHERVFDLLAFAIPTGPGSRLGETSDERKALAFAELLLRHELEHVVHTDRSEEQVVASDVDFVMFRRETDPTYYLTLVDALGDELTGLGGTPYLQLFERRERGEDASDLVGAILHGHAARLADVPTDLLCRALEPCDGKTQSRVIEACYARAIAPGAALFRRAEALHRALALFRALLLRNPLLAEAVFDGFRDRWGAVGLLGEMGIAEAIIQQTRPDALFELFAARLAELGAEERTPSPATAMTLPPPPEPEPAARKTLTERVEEAKRDPTIPAQVLSLIERNQVNAVGHSGAKYAELIETLLAIPWGRIRPITVSPVEFEAGLERSHYGLERPKEMLCDFFTNLIWRYQGGASGRASRSHAEPTSIGAAGGDKPGGSAFLLVGPPGVGKTSLAISVAETLGIPYHKLSLGGMRDEADLRGHGFTYEGSKPGAIVQGLIKMGAENGMFILDEADKTEAFAIATLLEILDPEQNHLFHDKYTQSTVDIDLSSCHFILTANTLETVPPPVLNRCEVILLDRYGIDEKIAIAERHLIPRIRAKYAIDEATIAFEPGHQTEHLRYLVQAYTFEAGVRQLERVIRTLLLRIHRKEILGGGATSVLVSRQTVKRVLEEPSRPRQVSPTDRVGEALGLGVNVALGVGSLIPIQSTRMLTAGGPDAEALSMVHATGNIERVMDESRKVATTAILHCATELGLPATRGSEPVHLHFMGGSTPKDGPSAGAAIALALTSLMTGRPLRRDVAITGEIDTQGRITAVGGLDVKLETAAGAGCKTVVIPRENLHGPGGIERFSQALRRELQILSYEQWRGEHAPFDHLRHVLEVVAVDHVTEAWQVAALFAEEVTALVARLVADARALRSRLALTAPPADQEVLVVVAKSADELEEELLDRSQADRPVDTWVLVPPSSERSAAERLPELDASARIVTFHPEERGLQAELAAALEQAAGGAVRPELSVIGPYYLLRQAIGDGVRPAGRLLANNYCLQEVKLKHSKPLLNRAYALLARLGPEAIEHCPLLTERDGVVVVDLSIIPERLRLDVSRAERILQQCFDAWLRELGASAPP